MIECCHGLLDVVCHNAICFSLVIVALQRTIACSLSACKAGAAQLVQQCRGVGINAELPDIEMKASEIETGGSSM